MTDNDTQLLADLQTIATNLRRQADVADRARNRITSLLGDLGRAREVQIIRPAVSATGPFRLYRLKEVAKMTGLGRSSIYAQIKLGTFPAPRKIGRSANAWHEDDLLKWLAAKGED